MIIWSNSDVNASSAWTPKVLNTFDDVVWHLSWSVSGNMLAVSGGDNKITLWKVRVELSFGLFVVYLRHRGVKSQNCY